MCGAASPLIPDEIFQIPQNRTLVAHVELHLATSALLSTALAARALALPVAIRVGYEIAGGLLIASTLAAVTLFNPVR